MIMLLTWSDRRGDSNGGDGGRAEDDGRHMGGDATAVYFSVLIRGDMSCMEAVSCRGTLLGVFLGLATRGDVDCFMCDSRAWICVLCV